MTHSYLGASENQINSNQQCSTDALEDEQHFLIECSKFNEYRNSLFQTVNSFNEIFINVDNFRIFL